MSVFLCFNMKNKLKNLSLGYLIYTTMKKLLVLGLFFISTIIYSQSVTIYRSYDDYKTEQGIKYDTYKKIARNLWGSKYRIVVRKSGKSKRIKCERIWGFMLEKTLFRTYGSGQYAMQISGDKLFYFENGEAYINKGKFIVGHYNFIATTVDGLLILLPNPDSKPDVIQQYEYFKKSYPQHKKFYDCFDKAHELENCRDCMDRYNYPDKIRPFQ